MPLAQGRSREVIAHNIAELIRAGHNPQQAAAIAYREASQDEVTTRVSFYTPVVLGKRQRLTPEGFLVCEAVPIARTGEMIYAAGEVPVDPAPNGLINVTRDESQVFRPETIASFEGKPVTDDHPDEDVTPANWRRLSVGTVTNVRRGEGHEADLLLADLIIQDEAAIKAVQDGKREVSCGYEADYEQIERGHGRQLNIIGNHVALVDEGRCGPRCAIGDRKSTSHTGDNDMAKRTVWDRIRTAFKANDEAALNEELEAAQKAYDEEEGENTHRLVIEMKPSEPAAKPEEETKDEGEEGDPIAAALQPIMEALAAISARLDKIEAAEQAEVTQQTGDEEADKEDEDEDTRQMTGDSASLQGEFADAISRAEILAPGIKLPTFDAKADKKKTSDSICALRRKALDKAMADEKMAAHVTPFVADGNTDFSKMTCDAVKLIFGGASELAKRANNRGTRDNTGAQKPANMISAINQANAEFWARK